MLECALAAENEGALPAELRLGLQCERWGALPDEGGILDQQYGLLEKMAAAVNVFRAIQSESQRGDQTLVDWTERNPESWKILAAVEKMRAKDSG